VGLLLIPGYRQVPQNRKTAVLQIPLPKTKRDIRSFLGLTGYFRIWIPNYTIIAKPPYKTAKGDLDEPLPCPLASKPLLTSSSKPYQGLLHFPSQIPTRLFTCTYTQIKAKPWAWWLRMQETW
jgi:hypothetical protein